MLQTPSYSLNTSEIRVVSVYKLIDRKGSPNVLREVQRFRKSSLKSDRRFNSVQNYSRAPVSPATLSPEPIFSSNSGGYGYHQLENVADNPLLGNPLERLHRMGTGWMGAIVELEGVLVEDTEDLHREAWRQVALQYGKSPPAIFQLKRAEGMKSQQVVSEVLNYARDPTIIRKIVELKERIYEELLGEREILEMPKARFLLDLLASNDTPCAVVSSYPERRVQEILKSTGLSSYFDIVLCAEDVQYGKPDPEIYIYAAQAMQRPPVRCVVVGSSNKSVEAAHEVGMQCLAVVGKKPVYEFGAADLVVRSLDELSFVNLKQLFRQEQGKQPELQEETEVQEQPQTRTATMFDM